MPLVNSLEELVQLTVDELILSLAQDIAARGLRLTAVEAGSALERAWELLPALALFPHHRIHWGEGAESRKLPKERWAEDRKLLYSL